MTTKYRVVVVTGADSQNETLIWIDEALGMPVRSETMSKSSGHSSKVTMELKDVKLEVDERLFSWPSDYRKVEAQQIFDLIRKRRKAGQLPNNRRNKPTSSYAQGIGKAHTEAVWRDPRRFPGTNFCSSAGLSSGFKKGLLNVKIRILSSVFIVSLLLAGFSSAVIAQTRRGVAATTRQSLLAKLPTSDAVAQVNVKAGALGSSAQTPGGQLSQAGRG